MVDRESLSAREFGLSRHFHRPVLSATGHQVMLDGLAQHFMALRIRTCFFHGVSVRALANFLYPDMAQVSGFLSFYVIFCIAVVRLPGMFHWVSGVPNR